MMYFFRLCLASWPYPLPPAVAAQLVLAQTIGSVELTHSSAVSVALFATSALMRGVQTGRLQVSTTWEPPPSSASGMERGGISGSRAGCRCGGRCRSCITRSSAETDSPCPRPRQVRRRYRFVGCEMNVRCTIGTADESNTSERRGYVEWPRRLGNEHFRDAWVGSLGR